QEVLGRPVQPLRPGGARSEHQDQRMSGDTGCMTLSTVHTLLNPDSVAVIGASDDSAKWGGSILSLLRKFDYPGIIYPINPKGGVIQGLQAYPSVEAIGQSVDVAVLAVPQERTRAALQDC